MNDETVVDAQTGREYKLKPESKWDVCAAVFSLVYLVAMLAMLGWLLIDFSVGKFAFVRIFIPLDGELARSALFKSIFYAVIGGGLGGSISGIRSIVDWHSERKAFSWRFAWKYLCLPLTGVVLAPIVYAIIRGGIAAFAGDNLSNPAGFTQSLSAFAIGALSGYGSNKVFVWLDFQVNRLLKITRTEKVKVSDFKGKTSRGEVKN